MQLHFDLGEGHRLRLEVIDELFWLEVCCVFVNIRLDPVIVLTDNAKELVWVLLIRVVGEAWLLNGDGC